MHYAPHALVNCVAWFSVLCYGNAAKGTASSEVLSHFARTVGSVLVPTLANELHGSRLNRSAIHPDEASSRTRQIESRQVSAQDPGTNAAGPAVSGPNIGGNSPLPPGFAGQGFPYQYERTYQYRYPPYSQQISENFFPGGSAGAFGAAQLQGVGGPGLDPRFFQSQLAGNHPLAPIQPEIPKPLNANINANSNSNNVKDNGNSNVNSIQNLDTNGDSKSSAQSRPFDSPDFSTVPVQPTGQQQPGFAGPIDPTGGNLRVDNRFSAIDYERIRQNYYSDPPLGQRNYYNGFNEIPFSAGGAGGGPPFRSPLSERYSNLDFNAGAGARSSGAGPSSELRSGSGLSGLGDPYFGSFLQGPYQSLNYNSLPGSGGAGGDGGPPFAENFDRTSNFRSPFGLQYPIGGGVGGIAGGGVGGIAGGGVGGIGGGGVGGIGGGGGGGFNSPFYPGGPGVLGAGGIGSGQGFNEADSSLRASSSKETLSEPAGSGGGGRRDEETRSEKVRFPSDKHLSAVEKQERSGGEA